MKKSINLCLAALLVNLTFTSCKKDDVNNESVNSNETTELLTGGSEKTWRISEATLINGNNELNISENFNVKDDEFVFKGNASNGVLVWKKGYEINTDAAIAEEALLDKYVSNVISSFSLQNGSTTDLSTDLNGSTFTINEDETISVKMTNTNATTLEFTLVAKQPSDYVSAPQQGLNFSNAFTFNSVGIHGYAPGMIGSYSDNSFFLVTREGVDYSDPQNPITGPERVLKFDKETNQITERLFHKDDYASKQLHIIGNKLIAFGGQYINTYDLDLSSEPTSIAHNKVLSRFGIAVLDDNAYIIGGDINNIESNKIFKWNLETETLTEFASLPQGVFGGRATIVGDYLYVFGGREFFVPLDGTKMVHKININNPNDISTFQINNTMDNSFVQKHEHLIYIAGNNEISDYQNNTWTQEFFIGVYNTLDDTYQEIPTNLTSITNKDTIHQMCVFNDKIYVLFGDGLDDNGEESSEWKILVADLN